MSENVAVLRHDSGLTPDQVDAILDELIDSASGAELGPDSGIIVGLRLGLLEGDMLHTSPAGTLLLPTPRTEIDRRVDVMRAAVASGKPLIRLLEANGPDWP